MLQRFLAEFMRRHVITLAVGDSCGLMDVRR
jgi:hypothetical protein